MPPLRSRPAAAGTLAVLTARAPFTSPSTGPAESTRRVRAIFLGSDLPVTVLIKCLQGFTRLRNLIGINDAVLVKVERLEEGHHRSWAMETSRSAWGRRRQLRAVGLRVVLSCEREGCRGERQRK